MNERLGVLPLPEHPRALQTQTGHPAQQALDAAGADGQALRPGRGVGQPVPVPLEVPELGLADPSALPARPPAPDPLRDGPDDGVGGAGHHEPPHAVQPPHALARVPVFNLYWNFEIFWKLAKKINAAGYHEVSSELALTLCILSCLTWVPFLNILVSLAMIVIFEILYRQFNQVFVGKEQ